MQYFVKIITTRLVSCSLVGVIIITVGACLVSLVSVMVGVGIIITRIVSVIIGSITPSITWASNIITISVTCLCLGIFFWISLKHQVWVHFRVIVTLSLYVSISCKHLFLAYILPFQLFLLSTSLLVLLR